MINFQSKLGGTHTMIDKEMSKQRVDSPRFSSVKCNDLLKKILSAFISSAPDVSVWQHRISMHPKGIAFPRHKSFPHFGTLLGPPDFTMTELFVLIKKIERRKYGNQKNADMRSYFKSNHHFSNNNVDTTRSKLYENHLSFIKIGDMRKGPAIACHEIETFGNHEAPQSKGQHRKAKKSCSEIQTISSTRCCLPKPNRIV